MNNAKGRKINGKLNVIGEKIGFYRKKENLSYQALSDKLMLYGVDINYHSLYKIEKGTRTIVDFELITIAKVLNISISELTDEYYKNLG